MLVSTAVKMLWASSTTRSGLVARESFGAPWHTSIASGSLVLRKLAIGFVFPKFVSHHPNQGTRGLFPDPHGVRVAIHFTSELKAISSTYSFEHARDAVQRGPVERSHCIPTGRDQPVRARLKLIAEIFPGCFARGITTSGQPS